MPNLRDDLRIYSLSDRLRWLPIARGNNILTRIQNQLLLSAFHVARQVIAPSSNTAVPDLSSAKIISHRYRFVYIAIPKVATSTFRHILLSKKQTDIGATVLYMDTPTLLRQLPETNKYCKFSFVRNPWSRVVSCYRNKIQEVRVIGHLSIMSRFKGLRPGMDFEEFVEWLASREGSDEKADRHWVSQHRILAGANGELACDYVGKHESLQDDFDHICRILSLPQNPLSMVYGVSRSGFASPTYYREYYTSRTRELVAERYQKDIELFGYDF